MRVGEGTPVVLLHGLSGSSNWWGRNIAALAERHLVAAVDLAGFGHSRRFLGFPILIPPFTEVSALLARWLETFEGPVHLIGHSMGGQIAIRLAAEHPDLIRSLTLVNATGMPFRFDARPHIRSLPKPPYGGAGIARVLVPDLLRAGPTSVAVASTRVVMGDMRELMHSLRLPVLLVWGEGDPLVPVVYAEAMQREIAGSRLVVLPGAAHVAMWDAPEAFNRVALGFIEEVESSAPQGSVASSFSWGIAGWVDGIAHRQAGRARDIVLIHGLGMSSAYFERFARALFARGWSPIAPDLRGFGESVDAAGVGPGAHAAALAAWADSSGIRDAVWIGHSIGCNVVAHLARLRPDLCKVAIHIGPVWTRHPFPLLRLFVCLALDALREPVSLYGYVIPAYWRTGIWRWITTLWRTRSDIRGEVPEGEMIAGERDPLPDRSATHVSEVAGAHACHFSNADITAEIIDRFRPPDREP
jgi:pimeloyl-ACP methyl ester carboxylesterase